MRLRLFFILMSIADYSVANTFVNCTSIGQKNADSSNFFQYGYNPKKIFVLGFESAGAGFNYKDTATWDKKYTRWMRFEPNLSWYPKYNLGIGIRGRIEFFRSNIQAARPDVYEFGGFVRYYWPIYSEKKFFRSMLVFTEVALSMANYHYTDKYATTIVHDEFDQLVLRIPFGFAFNVWKGFNIEIAPRFECYYKKYRQFDVALGLSYHFNRR